MSKKHFLASIPLVLTIAIPNLAIAQPNPSCNPPEMRVEAGLEKAIALKKINPDGALPESVRKYLAKIKACVPQEQALSETGLKIATIQKLEKLAPKGISLANVGTVNHSMANALIRGLTVANRTGEIGVNAQLSFQIQSLVRHLRRGDELSVGLVRSGVKQSVVDRLLILGILRENFK